MSARGITLFLLLGVNTLVGCADDDERSGRGEPTEEVDSGTTAGQAPGSDDEESDDGNGTGSDSEQVGASDGGVDTDAERVDASANDDEGTADEGTTDDASADDARSDDVDSDETDDEPATDVGSDDSTSGTDGGSVGEGVSECVIDRADASVDYLASVRSGSRLHVQSFTFDGMPDAPHAFFDTELGLPCSFEPATDGELRCLPIDRAGTTDGEYSDSQCNEPIYGVPPLCAGMELYVRKQRPCGDVEVLELEPLAETPGEVFRDLSGNCTSVDAELAPDEPFVGVAVEPTRFVRGEFVELPGACQATVRMVEADDGARAPVAVADARYGAACRWNLQTTSSHCVPLNSAVVVPGMSFFSDAACEAALGEVAEWSWAECRPPEMLRSSPDMQLATVGEMVLAEDAFLGPETECTPASDQGWIDVLYTVGEPVAEDEMASLDTTLTGDGRLQAAVTSEDGVELAVRPDAFWDTTAEQRCEPILFDDGQWRCSSYDSIGTVGRYFNDPECTERTASCSDDCPERTLVEWSVDTGACSVERVVVGVYTYRESATGRFELYAGDCVEAGEPDEDDWVLDPVDLSTLPVLEVVEAD